MTRLILICLGGAFGTGARYLIGLWAGRALGPAFPYGTLLVNVIGCFLIAAIAHVALTTDAISTTTRLTLTTGVMGGLTTYSSFNLETTTLIANKQYATAALNVSVTLVVCFVAGLLGALTARWLLRAS